MGWPSRNWFPTPCSRDACISTCRVCCHRRRNCAPSSPNPTEPDDPEGFLIGVNWRGTVSASQTPALQAAQNTAQAFLGVNLKCNSCHDSFISKWKLKDAYSLAAYFSNEEKLKLYRCDVAQEEYAAAGFLFPELNRPLASMAAPDRRAAAAAIFTDPRNGRMPRTLVNRIWQRLMGRGIVENVDEMDGEPWSPELLDWLASDFVAHGYDVKWLIRTILESRTYQLAAVPQKGDPEKQYTFRGPELRRLTAEEFSDAVAAITGDWHALAGRTASVNRPGPRGRCEYSASAATARSHGHTGSSGTCPDPARHVFPRLAHRRQQPGARARPAHPRPGVLHTRHAGHHHPGAGASEWRDADALAVAGRA
jgi:hypothetical protein